MMSRLETALAKLAQNSRLVGRAFCEAAVGAVADTLSVPIVLLAKIDATDSSKARTVAVWSHGRLVSNFDYALQGTPCRNVLTGDVCVYPNDVCALFPDDTLLVDMGAKGYLGTPLRALDGRAIGLLAAISDKALDGHPQTTAILELFAGRAAAELERESSISATEYFGRLVEGSSNEIYVFDAENMRFSLVNKGARDNLGYSLAELVKLTPLDLKPDFTSEAFQALVEPLRTGLEDVLQFRTRHRRKDGTMYPVQVRLQLIRDIGPRVFFASIEDITKSVETELRLRDVGERVRRLFAQSPAGIVETDTTGRMTLVNEAWCRMLGYSETELLQRRIFDVTHPDSMPQTEGALQALIDGSAGVIIEKNYVRKDGSLLPASSNVNALRSADGTFQGVAAVIVDVSDRLEAEKKIRESEELLRKIIDGSLAFIGILQPDGTLVEANAPALQAGGLAKEEVIGKKFWDCYWWNHEPQVVLRLQEAVARAASGELQRYDEVIRVGNDGRMTIDFMLSPILAEDGTVEFLVPSGFDISERKHQEALVRTLLQEVNHRSKNLLTVIQSIARQMRNSTPDEFVNDFNNRLQALAKSQDALLHGGLDSVTLATLIRTQLAHFGDDIEQRFSIDGPEIHVSASVAQSLGMAIYELATNAAKYGSLSNDAGKVAIAWSLNEQGAESASFNLEWIEIGGPPAAVSSRAGFGSFVLSRLVSSSVSGECVRDFTPDGLRWTLTCHPSKLSA